MNKIVRAARRFALAIVLLSAGVSCAAAPVSSGAGASAATSTASPLSSKAASGAVGSANYAVIQASGTKTFTDVNATFVPFVGDSSGLKTADEAYKAVLLGLGNLAGSAAGPSTVALFDYSNSAHGQIQADGSVKPDLVHVPVWLFVQPLTHYIDVSQGKNGGPKTPRAVPTNCSYLYVVNASDGQPLTSWQECGGA